MGYHLETITARNQTRDFEIFCRKLGERIICPNLKPATGPEGMETSARPMPVRSAGRSPSPKATAGSLRLKCERRLVEAAGVEPVEGHLLTG